MQNTINLILKYSVIFGLSAVAFIPLYVANPLFFPFITGKAFAFRIIVEIVFALWLILVLREKGSGVAGTDRSVAPRMNLLTKVVTVFTALVLISDLAGVNPLRSIWSNSERMEGWITIVHLWAYFMALSSIWGAGNEAKLNFNRFLNVTIFSATIVAIYGLFQYFGWAAIHQGSSRVDASLGNSAYMAVYMLIHAFLAFYMAVRSYLRKIPALSYIYGILAVFYSFIMFQTATRGTIVGWVVAIIVSCAIYVIWGNRTQGKGNILKYISGGAVLLIILFTGLLYNYKNSSFVQKSEVLSRLASISISDTKTQARGYTWPMALKGSTESIKTFTIGWGQENFNYIFNKNYDPKMWKHEQWFDRAHSVYLDWLVATGVIGLLLYLSLYLISLWFVIRSNISIGEKSALIGLLVGYAIHNVFVFDNQTSYVMFFTVLVLFYQFREGKICLLFRDNGKKVSEDYVTVVNYIFVPVIVIAFMIGFYFINIRNIQANLRLISSLQSCSNPNTISTKYFESALSLNQTTENQEIREQLISCAVNALSSESVSPKTKQELYLFTKKEIENQIKTTPNDARIYILATSLYHSIGDWSSALPMIMKARELTPRKQAPLVDLAVNYINTNKPSEAVEVARQAYELATDNPMTRSMYVIALINNKEEAKAREIFPNSPELFTDQRIVNIYVRNKQFDKAVNIYKSLLEKNPDDINIRTYLASVYYTSGQTALAIQELRNLKERSPQLKDQVDNAIKDIESGKKPNSR